VLGFFMDMWDGFFCNKESETTCKDWYPQDVTYFLKRDYWKLTFGEPVAKSCSCCGDNCNIKKGD